VYLHVPGGLSSGKYKLFVRAMYQVAARDKKVPAASSLQPAQWMVWGRACVNTVMNCLFPKIRAMSLQAGCLLASVWELSCF